MFAAIARRIGRRSALMGEMMQRLHVDPARTAAPGGGQALASAARRCLACTSADTCQRWLDDPATEGQRPAFCPNVDTFARFRSR